ncbi:MAG: T9SS type A sorting domain-containing protein [Taibaiella sp.]|nr:T9SS type A sorting domain-containing protein [Taibaiella sp.]
MKHAISFASALIALVSMSLCAYAQPTAGQRSAGTAPVRLLSMARLLYDGVSYTLADSTYYRYHGDRTGHYDEAGEAWVWDYDTCMPLVFTGWTSTYVYSKEYDAAGNCVRELTSRKNSTAPGWQPESAIEYGYDADNNVNDELSSMWNAAGGTMDPVVQSTYSYSADNKVRAIGHRVLATAWGDSSTTHYVYDAAGRISFIYYEAFNATLSMTVPVTATIYAYDAAGDRVSRSFVSWTGSNWDTSQRYIYSDITDHLPAIEEMEYKDTVFKKSYRAHYTYNAHGLPLFVYYESWSGSAWQVDTGAQALRFHYEEMPNAVIDAIPTTADMNVYPVPAHDMLMIAINREDSEPATLRVTDMQGRVWISLDVSAGKQWQHNLPVNNLPPGNYNVTLQGKAGSVTRRVVVM